MFGLTEERVTLIAAIVAAAAAITTAILTNRTTIDIAAFEAIDSRNREFLSFRRNQIDYLTKLAFNSSIELSAQLHSSNLVAWISESSEAKLAEQSNTHIERIRHAYSTLVAMKAVPEKNVNLIKTHLDSLLSKWRTFTSTRASYREAVKNKVIEKSGYAKGETAKKIQAQYLKAIKKVNDSLEKIRKAVVIIHAETSIPLMIKSLENN